MICNSCGATIPEDSVFCENCGAPLEPVETPEEDMVEEAEPEMAEEAEPEMAEEAEKESVEETEDDFKEIEELEAMEEVEFPEADIPEEAQLPDLNELDFEQTGQPEGSETEWLESFQQLSPKEEDWPEEPAEEEVPIEDLEEEFEEAEEAEEEVPIEDLEEDLEEAEEEAVEEEAVEEADEFDEAEETEEAEEEVPIEDLEEDFEEAEEEAVEEEVVEEAEETEEEPIEEETGTEEPEDEPTEEKKAISEGAEKVNSWLGNLGKSVRTGTGWAVDIAKGKASNTKKRSEKKGERDQWSKEEEGDLDLGYDFWYKSNQADTSSRYAGMEEEEEENKTDDATTYVAVKRNQTDREEMDEESEGAEQKKKKPANKLKITVIILLIAALIGAGGIFGSKTYTENKEQEAYQASLTKAEKLVEKKDYESAEKIYQDLLAEYPDRAELYENLAALYMNEEKFDDAKNTINEGIARTGKSKAYAALSEDLDALTSTEWREPFRRVLANNEWAVKRYDDINGSCVALCDITGDKRPEMMFFTQEYFGYGKLHVVVYDDEKAKELSYDCKNRSTQYQDAFYDIENDESGYIIYKSKKAGKFGIFASFKHGGIDEWSTINRYTLSGTSLDRDSVFEACITTSYRVSEDDEDDGNTKYYKGENEKEIKYDSYIKEFNAVLNDIDQVIMTSENTAGDKEIWNRIMDIDEAAMTYSEAMKILDEDAI